MRRSSWNRRRYRKQTCSPSRRYLFRYRPLLEQLEDRTVPDAGFGGGFYPPPGGGDGGPGDDNPGSRVAIVGVSDDTGKSSSDWLTNDTTLTVRGTAPAGMELMVSTTYSTAYGQAGDDGTFAIALPDPLPAGEHYITVRSLDGGIDGDSKAVIIDTSPPHVELLAPTYTLDAKAEVVVLVSSGPTGSADEIDSTVRIDVDFNRDGSFDGPGERDVASGTLDGEGAARLTLPQFGYGSYLLRARGFDKAGNEGLSDPAVLRIGREADNLPPLHFEENVGQFSDAYAFAAHARDYSVFFTSGGAVLSLATAAEFGSGRTQTQLGIGFGYNAATQPSVVGLDKLEAKSNYLIGNVPDQWRTGIANYGEVHYVNIVPGVSAVFRGDRSNLQMVLLADAEADLSQLALSYTGAGPLSIGEDGELRIDVGGAVLRQSAPLAYQGGSEISGTYILDESGQARFEFGAYDAKQPLRIETTIRYVSPLGDANAYAFDSSGNLYVAGSVLTGAPGEPSGDVNLFIKKIAAQTNTLLSTTYLGGAGAEALAAGNPLAVDGGSVYLIGSTSSVDFPSGSGGGDGPAEPLPAGAFLARLNAAGDGVAFVTSLSALGLDTPHALAIGGGGVFVAGATSGAAEGEPGGPGGFGAAPGSGGTDAFLARFSGSGELAAKKTFGGSGSDTAWAVAVDGAGRAAITGTTTSPDLPLRNAVQASLGGGEDVFVAQWDATGDALAFATYFGGSGDDAGRELAFDTLGGLLVGAQTNSADFPTTAGAAQTAPGGGVDAALLRLADDGSKLDFATFVGGADDEQLTGLWVDGEGFAYLSGNRDGEGFLSVLSPSGDALAYSLTISGSGEQRIGAVFLDTRGNILLAGETTSPEVPDEDDLFVPNGVHGSSFAAVIHEGPLPVVNSSLGVAVGGAVTITPEKLKFGHLFKDPERIRYRLAQPPTQGTLRRDGLPLGEGATFTQADINAGRITYSHGGSTVPVDGFSFYVSAGGPYTPFRTFIIAPGDTLPKISTTASTAPVFPALVESGPLIGINQARADRRFADIDGRGFASVVLDTGIDLDHPFFGPDSDGNGIADRIVFQYDFADNDNDASDFNNHGSNVTSIVASQDPVYTGMAPATSIIHLKVFRNSGANNFTPVESALQWVVANAFNFNIASVNMSLGDQQNYSTPQTLYNIDDELATLAALNVIVVSAAGNDFARFGSVPGVAYPAADPNSLAVGAVYDADVGPQGPANGGAQDFTTAPDRVASFSQRHPTLTDIFAPGAFITGANRNGGTVAEAGTSQASPHVAGIATLAQQLAFKLLGRRLTFDEFRDLIQRTGKVIFDGDDENDNVVNTGREYRRIRVPELFEEIFRMRQISVPSENDGNNTSERATDLGTLRTTTTYSGLAIGRTADGLVDYDWYKFTAGVSGTVSISLTNIKTVTLGDLHLRVYKLVNGRLIEVASSTETGGKSQQSVTFTAEAGVQYFIWVYGFAFEQGLYDLEIKF